MTKTTLADDCETVLRHLVEAPEVGLSQDDLVRLTGWSYRAVNSVLCDLMPQIKSHKVRERTGKVTRYKLRHPA